MENFKFCPNCKKILTGNIEKVCCNFCGFTHYFDVAACASTIPIRNSKILIAIRGKDPYKGAYDLIGGFIKGNESAEEAAIRETYEETGLKVKIDKYLGSYSDTYGENGKYTLGVTFIVKILAGSPKASDDVAKLKWVEIKDIPKIKFNGLKNTKEALMDFYKLFGRET